MKGEQQISGITVDIIFHIKSMALTRNHIYTNEPCKDSHGIRNSISQATSTQFYRARRLQREMVFDLESENQILLDNTSLLMFLDKISQNLIKETISWQT